jgi:alkylation response protein AidB-like acyl-CoA dehydrogenase
MSFSLTPEQRELRAVARDFFTELSPEAEVRRLMTAGTGYDPRVWKRLTEELGVQGLAVPERYGGSGFGYAELGVVLEEAGAALFGAPLLPTVLALEALLASRDEGALTDLAPRLAAHGLIGAIALTERAGQWPLRAMRTQAFSNADGWTVSGEKVHVVDGQNADLIVVSARTSDGPAVFVVERNAHGLTVVPEPTLDQTRRQAHLKLDRTPARLLGTPRAGVRIIQRVEHAAWVLLGAEQVSGAARALDLSVEYCATREQYGRKIGSFQAVKHLCADTFTRVEAARSAVYDGLRALTEDAPDLPLAAGAAKIFCSETFTAATAACVQLHGAIGFTWEHPAQLYFKRAKAAQVLFGTPSAHRARLTSLLDDDAENATPMSDRKPAAADSPAEAAFRVEVRRWLAENLVGEFADHRGVGSADDAEHWDVRLRWERKLADGGWLGLTWPTEFGGRGLPLSHEIIFTEECARAGAPYRVGVHGQDLFGPTLLMFGSDTQKKRFLPAILAVREFWGQGFSEPGAGSDLAALRTTARREGDDWVIDGQKTWMTFGAYADWLYVLCRTDPKPGRHRGLSLLMVPVNQPGVDIRPIRNMAGAAEFCEVFFTGARTAADNVVGEPGDGWRVALGALAVERGSLLMPVQLGFEREVSQALACARERAAPAGLRDRLIDSWVAVRLMRAANLRTIAELKAGTAPGPQAVTSKLFASTEHQRLLELATEVLAEDASVTGADYTLSPLQRAFLLSRAETIYGGSSQVQRNIIAERLLGMPREPRPAEEEARS